MIKIGEKLNSSIPRTREAVERRDAAYVAGLARRQLDAGADALDVNAAAFVSDEPDALVWLVGTVQKTTGARLMIDTPNPKAAAAALAADAVGGAILNSVTLEDARLAAMLPLVAQYHAGVVALPISSAGMPKTAAERLENVGGLMERLHAEGIADGRIYIDPLVETLSSDHLSAAVTLETIRLVRAAYPAVNILCGVSNVSFGLPGRKALNAAFLTGALLSGANAAIFDVAEPAMREAAAVAEALAGRDEYCMGYISHFRANAAGRDSQ